MAVTIAHGFHVCASVVISVGNGLAPSQPMRQRSIREREVVVRELEPNISKLGFGLMRLPKLEDGSDDIEQVKQMVDAFIAAGGTYFDTARAYGNSEATIRQALVERYPRESFYLATKNAAWIGQKTEEEAKGDFDESLRQTGAGYFDFYLIHNTGNKRTKVFDDFGMWDFVKQLKADGKVRHIGFSHHDNADVLDDLLNKHPEMEFVQLQVNYADWDTMNIQSRLCVEVAHKHGVPVVVMEPVRGGTLAQPPEAVAKILSEANPDASYVSWALRFVFGLEDVTTALSGMSTLEQMEQNIATWKGFEPLSEEERAVLDRARKALAESLDNPCTACHYCMKGCPKDINISGAMDALNREAMFGKGKGQNQYNFEMLNNGKASECIQCYQCEDACPQHIPIVEKLERAAELFEQS